jgi:hypothetical protein
MLDSMTRQYCDGETDDAKKDQDVEGYPSKTCKKALSVFYATCKEKGLDYTKPMPKEKVREHVSAILPFTILEKIVDKPLRIRGLAITAGMSRNFNIYTPEELQAFASKLVAAPMYIEHVAVPNAVGKVTKTEWDGGNLWYEAKIYDDEVAAQIRKGLIQHVSVGADYETLDIVDGQVPHGLHNAELSLVAVPGIPQANVQVLEKLLRKKEQQEPVQPIVAGEYVLGFYQDVCLFLPEHFRTVWLDKENGILAVFGKLSAEPETERVQSIFFAKEKMWDQTKIQDWLSIHPDYMAPAGDSAVSKAPLKEREKMKKKRKVKEQVAQPEPKDDKQRFMNHAKIDEETFQLLYAVFGDQLFTLLPERGQKTKEQDGEIKPSEDESKEDFIQRCKVAGNDEPHCQAIWDKAHPGSSTAEQLKEDSQITSDVCSVEPSDQEQLQAKVTELLARVDKLEKGQKDGNLAENLLKKSNEPTIKVKEAIEILEGLLPSPMVERSSMGMQRECQAIRGAVLQLKEMLKNG